MKNEELENLGKGEYNQFRGWSIPADENPDDEGYPVVEEITMAEYEQWLAAREASSAPEVPDPEDTEPVIPEDTDPVTVLTRAELTEKVSELDEALHMLLSGVTEDG